MSETGPMAPFSAVGNFFAKLYEIFEKMKTEDIDNLIAPLHETITIIDSNYLKVFYGMRSKMRILQSKKEEMELFEIYDEIKKEIEKFEEERKEYEPLRDKLRNNVQGYLKSCKNEDVKDYLTAISIYFTANPKMIIPKNSREIEHDIEQITRKGGLSHLATPSTKLFNEIRNSRNPEFILSEISDVVSCMAFNMAFIHEFYYKVVARRI